MVNGVKEGILCSVHALLQILQNNIMPPCTLATVEIVENQNARLKLIAESKDDGERGQDASAAASPTK